MPGTSCPSCAAELPIAAGFASWCPSCEWNLVTKEENSVPWRLRVQRRLLDGASDRLVTELSGASRVRSRARTWSAVGASLLALPVHLLTLICFAGGAWLLITGWTWPLRVLGGIGVLIAVGTRPAIPRRPKHGCRLDRADAPELYALVEEIATVTGAAPPREILIDGEFNAAAVRFGLRGRMLILGAPFWVATPPQARIALIGHELGHFAHHDLTYGLWIGTAYSTLQRWYQVLTPARFRLRRKRGTNTIEDVAFALLRPVVAGYVGLLDHVNAPAHRRQEHYADMDAAKAGGTEACLDMFDTLLAVNAVSTAITRAAVSPSRPDIWQVIGEEVGATPPLERERRRRVAAREHTRIDSSHPVTTLRIRLARERIAQSAAVVADTARWQRIDAELQPALAAIGRDLGERVRYSR